MDRTTRTWRLGAVALTAGSLVAASAVALPAAAAPKVRACENRANVSYDKLLECVTLDGVVEHLEAFQAIADANGGNRADQTPGYQASVDYVVDQLESYGWDAEVVPFTYPGVDATVQQLSPVSASYGTGAFTGTGEGAVTGTVVPVDLSLANPAASTSGCEAADFAGVNLTGPADVVLVQRGACTFGTKATNAVAAGAEAVLIMNTGTPGNEGVLTNVTLGGQFAIPVIGLSFADGQALAAQTGTRVGVEVDFFDVESFNVIGELAGRTDGNVVMAGSHLDSVPAGPGINDNGSGSAALLEVAQMMAKSKPQNTVRFAWWGAEELGLIGSTEWVEQRTQEELDEIALYLNFDMIGSPNYYFGVYDADESSFVAPVVVPDGSEQIEETFESFYTLRGEPYDDSAFSGRSDYQAFINNGIASGGLFTGAEVVKTAQQQAIWGGTAGAQFDPCYHLVCDTIDNYDAHALEVNSDAVAFAVFRYAASTEAVNGVEGRKVPGRFSIPAPAGPEYTFAGPLGGDEHDHDHSDDDE